MESNGYTFRRDKNFSIGEQYWVYKKGVLKGWVRFCSGILRVAHTSSKDNLLPSPFLIHDLFGPDASDFFPSGKDRRKAIRLAAEALSDYYKDSRSSLKQVLAIMGPAVPVVLEQQDLFGGTNV